MGLVIVSRFDIVSFTSFLIVQVKVVCGPEKVAVIQAGFCGERSVYMCAEEKGPGANQAGTNSL